MKFYKYSKKLLEAKEVFEENVCDSTVSWESAFNSYHYYIDTLRAEYSSLKNSNKELYTAYEIHRCSSLLREKHLNPKALGTSFALWKDNYRW
jgi:hypothetical protein